METHFQELPSRGEKEEIQYKAGLIWRVYVSMPILTQATQRNRETSIYNTKQTHTSFETVKAI